MKKRNPICIIMDILIAILTVILAVVIVATIRDLNDRDDYRYEASNYTYSLQGGDYKSLANSFYLGSYHPIEEDRITQELQPYAAVGGYYLDSVLLGIYETMPDAARAKAIREDLEIMRLRMGVYDPEADKIDKIFDTH